MAVPAPAAAKSKIPAQSTGFASGLKVMILARFSTKTAYLNSKNRNAFCKNIEILSFYRKCELCLFRITSYRVQVKPPHAYKFIRSMSIHSLCIKLDSCPHLLLHFSLIFCFCL